MRVLIKFKDGSEKIQDMPDWALYAKGCVTSRPGGLLEPTYIEYSHMDHGTPIFKEVDQNGD